MKDDDLDLDLDSGRSAPRRFFAMLIIAVAVAHSLGVTLRIQTQLEANDISRWCTIWALLERGSYVIDDCPWQVKTQDKVYKPSPFDPDKARPDAAKHYYSSKPPLLPTIVAGILYPVRKWTGVPVDKVVFQPRIERESLDPTQPEKVKKETPPDYPWPSYVLYFKPVVVLVNIVPYLFVLIGFARLLDRYVRSDWAWFAGLLAAAWGTPLTAFNTTLNNHTVAAYSAFFAIFALIKLFETPRRRPIGDESASTPRPPYGAYASCGFWAAFTACNELPAAVFGVLAFLILLVRSPKATLLAFVPAAIVPCAGFLATLYLATGGFTPFYAEFGSAAYRYPGSYWNTPLEMDWFDLHPEPKGVYLFHMMLGHHGMFSLTPIFLLAIAPMVRSLFGRSPGLKVTAWLTLLLTIGLVVFYVLGVKTANYGGSTNGLRWLFWVYPLWLVFVPLGFESGRNHRGMRGLGAALLATSVFSVGYGMRTPWSHPWILDMLEHLNLYTLTR